MISAAHGVVSSSMEDYLAKLVDLAKNKAASTFRLQVNLPKQGRADVPIAATDHMSIVLKAYASGGENALHSHINEDHTFVVLQGTAKFFDKDGGVLGVLEEYEGVMLPRGSYYRFEAGEDLVMLRIGTADLNPSPKEAFARVDVDGRDMDAYSKENKEIPLIMSDRWFPSTATQNT